jgi:sodium/potassium-transporting ATPase subunit alpha
VVYATGMRTEFGRIAALTHRAVPAVSPLQREIARLSRLVAALAAALGAIFFLIGHAIGLPFWDDLMFAIGIIVANVPEGLLPTVTLSLAMATQRMARRNALVRHLPAVEALGATTVICSDKTGTLTQNRMAVVRVFTGGEPMAAGCWRADPQDRGDGGDGGLLGTVSACHDLVRDASGRWLGDPLELALLEFAGAHAGVEVPARVAELPFDSERRRMSVVCGPPGQRTLHCKGALESLLAVSTRVREGERTLPLDTAARARWQTAQDAMAADGLRVIALARRTLAQAETAEESDLTLIGLLGIEDPPRPEVPDAIRRCREAGIKVVMVTGDHPSTALAIGRQIGLLASPAPSVIRGERLAGLTDAELQLALDAPELVFARVSAEQKLRIVRALQAKGHVVAVTGDGVNDAPALEAADVGIAMGIAGTDVAREAADMVLLDDNFASIVNAIEEGRAVFENIRKFLTYILTSNVPELVPYLAFVLLRIPLPLTVVQILAVDLGTDMLPALALGAEPPHPGLMRRPPRPPQERLLSPAVLARAYLFLGPMEAAIAMAAYFFVLDGGGWVWGQPLAPDDPLYRAATTACLAAIVVAQVANAFLCRDARQPGWSTPLSGNPLLAWGIAAELLLITIVVYAPAGQALFGTAPLDAEVWLLAAALASSMLVFEETRKRIARRRDAHAPA